ncbi:MAG TPA: HAMP domain-containing sensor histidine kinase [Steroidobacteraceae bacterium]|nr:HAMP domain-containing sensor histidine kinase [Steroidobacteraceae bacterium]
MAAHSMEAETRAPTHFGSPLRTSAFRLALAYCALFTIGVSVLLGTIYLLTETALSNEVDHVIAIELDALADEYDSEGLAGVTAELTRLNETWGRARAIYLLVDRRLQKIAGNMEKWPFGSEVPRSTWFEFTVESGRESGTELHPVRARMLTLPEGYLLVGTEISQRRVFRDRFRAATLWGIGGTALLGTLMGFWLSRRLLARVRTVSGECERILAGDLSRRLPVSGASDEFDSLASAVNRVLARLDRQTGVLRATFESAAHDLRGPLFRVRGRLEELIRDAATAEDARVSLDRALQDIDSLQRTLAVLLQIAHAESGAPLAESAPVALGDLVSEICALYEPAARDQGLTLDCDVEPANVIGNRQLLTQLLVNLIENGLRHVGRGGAMHVTVRNVGRIARLEVADNGPGIPPEDRERALRPFVQLSTKSPGGSGLGLSLVAAIARLHHARLALEDNAPGLRVVVELESR